LLLFGQEGHIFPEIDGLAIGLISRSMGSIFLLPRAVQLHLGIGETRAQVINLPHGLRVPLVQSLQRALISLLYSD